MKTHENKTMICGSKLRTFMNHQLPPLEAFFCIQHKVPTLFYGSCFAFKSKKEVFVKYPKKVPFWYPSPLSSLGSMPTAIPSTDSAVRISRPLGLETMGASETTQPGGVWGLPEARGFQIFQVPGSLEL